MQEFKNKKLVIVGKGEIGTSLALKAQAFAMQVIFSERKNATHCREGFMPFDQAIQEANILSLHCILNDDTKVMINLEVLSKMKNNSFLINVGLGALINTDNLIKALEEHRIAGFTSDVLDQEPPAQNHPLLKLQHPNLIITAHIAWATEEAQQRLFSILESNINLNMQGTPQKIV